jgi:aminoacyl tRNA synthase complex-interacting multifunctional protein 1
LSGKVKIDSVRDPREAIPPLPPVDDLSEIIERQKMNRKLPEENPSMKHGDTFLDKKSDEIDFSKLDIRVGVISKASMHPDADSLYIEDIDIGEDVPRQIVSGLRAYYDLDGIMGQRVLVLTNLKSRKLVGVGSHGMVLCASTADGNSVSFVHPPSDAKVGERVFVAGCVGEAATESQVSKKKMLEKVLPFLRTNKDGIATYKGLPLETSAGPCRSLISDCAIS